MSEKPSLHTKRSRAGTPSKVRTPNSSLSTSKLRDLSTARLERKRRQTLSTSRSSDNIETAQRVNRVASLWSLMKQKYKTRSAQGSLTEMEMSASAVRLVNLIKATSNPASEPPASKAVPISTKKILFKKKAGSPGRAPTPQQGDVLLSKLLQFTDTFSAQRPEERKKGKAAQKVIEVSFIPSRPLPAAEVGNKKSAKEEKRKPRLIEVSMT